MTKFSLFLPRTMVHMNEVFRYLSNEGRTLGMIPETLMLERNNISFVISKDIKSFNCRFYITGLFVVESTGLSELKIEAEATEVFHHLLNLWPSVREQVTEGFVTPGASQSEKLNDAMIEAVTDFVQKSAETIRKPKSESRDLNTQFEYAIEAKDRILQAKESLSLHDAVLEKFEDFSYKLLESQINFTLLFVDLRTSRLQFKLESSINKNSVILQWLIGVFTVVLVIVTVLIYLKG